MDEVVKPHAPPAVYLVGAGPGHPGLITRRGLSLLRAADVIIADALVHPELLLEARSDALVVRADRGKGLSTEQRKAATAAMVEYAKSGKMVVRLKGGDPFLFGRVMEEVEALEAADLAFDIVPGVSSAFAVPGLAGVPLTDRTMASSVVLVTGSSAPGREPVDFGAFGNVGDTLVVLMGLGKVRAIADSLMTGGRSAATPAVAISWGTVVEQSSVEGTLGNLADKLDETPLPTPGILVIGEVVGLRDRLAIFERRPLFGLKVVVTRSRAQSHEFVRSLSELGAKPLLFPTIDVQPRTPDARGREYLQCLAEYDGVFFTSVNAVRRLFEELNALGMDARAFSGVQVIAVGKATAEALSERGINADLVPARFSQEGILDSLGEDGIRGRRFLYPQAARIQETLNQAVALWGGELDSLVLYETITQQTDAKGFPPEILEGNFDVVTFTSPSSVRGFDALLGHEKSLELLASKSVVAIGPTTAGQLRDLGVSRVITPSKSTMTHMLELLIALHHGEVLADQGQRDGN